MLDKSWVICYSTPNYSRLTNIFLESLKKINFDENNIKHLLDIPTNKFKGTGFQTDLWFHCIKCKLYHIINLIDNCEDSSVKYFICSDCDINFIENNSHEWNNLEQYINDSDKDIFFMRENKKNDINGGFYIIKNNENVKIVMDYFKEVVEKMETTPKKNMPYGDQTIINKTKDKLNYGFIPVENVIWGPIIHNHSKALFHHAVQCKDVEGKIKQINLIKSKFV